MTIKAIQSTLEDYAKAYCAKDIDSLMSVFDDSDNISLVGTGSDEFCVGRAEIKNLFLRNFGEATAYKFEWSRIDTRISDNHAVVSARIIIHLECDGNQLSVPIRWTVVLINKNNRWLWIHRNASIAASTQNEGDAYPQNQLI